MAAMEVEVVVAAAGVLLLMGFICGYAVRELISGWRRLKAERRRFERMVEEVAQTGKQERLAITFEKSHGAPEG
jgi:hypothetical protein